MIKKNKSKKYKHFEQSPTKKKEFPFSAAIISVNLLIFAVIAGIIYISLKIGINTVNTDEDTWTIPESSALSSKTPPALSTKSTLEETQTSTTSWFTPPDSMTKASTTRPSIIYSHTFNSSQNPSDVPIGNYDADFFANDLFIGDSIFTGLSLYGYLSSDNVFAKIGLSPLNIETSDIDGVLATQKAETMKPKRIFIMLGSNSIAGTTGKVISDYTETFIKNLKSVSSDSEIYVTSIPPVSKAHNDNKAEKLSDILEANQIIKEMAQSNGVVYIDLYSQLLGEDGYFSSQYSEQDGLHFKSDTYKVMLSLFQNLAS